MLQSLLFLIIAGFRFSFSCGASGTRLGWGYALVLTVPITIALWLAIDLIVDLGRI